MLLFSFAVFLVNIQELYAKIHNLDPNLLQLLVLMFSLLATELFLDLMLNFFALKKIVDDSDFLLICI